MRFLVTLVVAAASLGVEMPARLKPSPAQSVFRSGIELVTLHVTVTDERQRYVTDIVEEEVEVLENGRPQQIKYFQPKGLPLALTLLLDTSASMQYAFAKVRDAAVALIRQLEPTDIACVITFADSFKVLQGFTSEKPALEAALAHMESGDTTSLYSAVYIALKELNRTPSLLSTGAPRRQAIVVLSDGDDSSSAIRFEELVDLASRTDALIYAVRLGSRERAEDNMNRAAFVLKRLAEQTGGRALFPLHSWELPTIYRAVMSDLSSQYALAYESDDIRRDARFRRISVQVDRAGVVARTRQGYFAGGS
jgi:Ca-activated chloride channel family protein